MTNPLRDPRDRRLPRVPEPVRAGRLRRHRRPGPQEAHPGGLRPRQPRAAAAGVRAARLRPPRLGRRRLRAGRQGGGAQGRPHRVPRGGVAAAGRLDPLPARLVRRRRRLRHARRDADRARRLPRDPGQRRVLPVDPAGGLPDRAAPDGAHRHGRQHARRGGWRRVVVEKPFGTRPAVSASELNELVDKVFTRADVFRIDHYLGKETVQNLLALRFANTLFEPIWNSHHIDSVQITMAEDVGIGTPRRVLRADRRRPRRPAEPPAAAARADRDGRAGQLRRRVAAHREAQGARARSRCRRTSPATPSAASTTRAGWPASGSRPTAPRRASTRRRRPRPTPRSGSTSTPGAGRACRSTCAPASGCPAGSPRSASSSSKAPHLPFSKSDTEELGANQLVVRVQPDEGVTLRFGSKVPGTAMEVRDVAMDFLYGEAFTESCPEAYERLLLDVLLGDAALFPQQRGGRGVLAGHRPDRGALGRAGRVRAACTCTAPASGVPAPPTTCWPRDGRAWRRP